MSKQKRYLVWLQDTLLEGFVLDSKADLQFFLQGYSDIEPEENSIGVSALARDMRDGFEDDAVIVQTFEIDGNDFGIRVIETKRMAVTFPDDEVDDPPGSYDDHCSKV